MFIKKFEILHFALQFVQSAADHEDFWRQGGGGGVGDNGSGETGAEKEGKSKKTSFFAELTGAKSSKRMQVRKDSGVPKKFLCPMKAPLKVIRIAAFLQKWNIIN